MTTTLTDAQFAAALQMDFRQLQAARRKGLIPQPRLSTRQISRLQGESA